MGVKTYLWNSFPSNNLLLFAEKLNPLILGNVHENMRALCSTHISDIGRMPKSIFITLGEWLVAESGGSPV